MSVLSSAPAQSLADWSTRLRHHGLRQMDTMSSVATGGDEAVAVGIGSVGSGTDTMQFGAFPITETAEFPPATESQCWAYLTLNAEIALSLSRSPALQSLLRSPRVRVSIDGQWLWWAMRRKYPGRPIAKLSGSDLIHVLAAHCAQHGLRVMLLGASSCANAAAVDALRTRHPGLQVTGFAPPQVAEEHAEEALQSMSLDAIRMQQPHYVVLGLGASKEQRFALRMLPALDGTVHGLLCFGGAIDLVSGLVRRAPPAWQRLGVEGLYRVLQQPSRSWRLLGVLRILPILMRGDY